MAYWRCLPNIFILWFSFFIVIWFWFLVHIQNIGGYSQLNFQLAMEMRRKITPWIAEGVLWYHWSNPRNLWELWKKLLMVANLKIMKALEVGGSFLPHFSPLTFADERNNHCYFHDLKYISTQWKYLISQRNPSLHSQIKVKDPTPPLPTTQLYKNSLFFT